MAEWLGAGLQNPSLRFNSGRRLQPVYSGRQTRALSSEGERFLDTEEASGSIPLGPTGRAAFRIRDDLLVRSSILARGFIRPVWFAVGWANVGKAVGSKSGRRAHGLRGDRASTYHRSVNNARCLLVGAVVVLVAGCQSNETTTTVIPTTTTTQAVATTTTTVSTTTTSPPHHRLELDVRPSDAYVKIETGDRQVSWPEMPFDGEVIGPIKVTVAAEGYGTRVETLNMEGDLSKTIWLDRPGQLLHKITEFETAGAPKQVAFTPDNTELWVTLLNGRSVQVFDPLTGEELMMIEFPKHGSVEVIFNREGTLAYVSQMETASVFEIDVSTHEVLRNFKTGGSWTKVLALSPDEKTLWASNWVSNDVSEIDLVTGELRERIRTVTTPRGLYVTPDGDRLYVAGYKNGDIQVIDLETREKDVIYRSGGAMRHLVGDPATGMMFASDMARKHVLVIDTATNEVRELAVVDRVPNTIDLTPDGRMLFVSNRGRNNPETYYWPGPEWGTVVVVDTKTGAYLDALVCGNQTTGLDVSSDGALLAYSDFLDNRVSVYSIPSYEVMVEGGGGRWEAHLGEIAKRR